MDDIDRFIIKCESYKIATEGANTEASYMAKQAIQNAKMDISDALRLKYNHRNYDARDKMDSAIQNLRKAKDEIHHLPSSIGSFLLGNIIDDMYDIAKMIGADIVGKMFGKQHAGRAAYKITQAVDITTVLYRAVKDYANDDLNLNNFNQYINSLMNDIDIMIAKCEVMKRFM